MEDVPLRPEVVKRESRKPKHNNIHINLTDEDVQRVHKATPTTSVINSTGNRQTATLNGHDHAGIHTNRPIEQATDNTPPHLVAIPTTSQEKESTSLQEIPTGFLAALESLPETTMVPVHTRAMDVPKSAVLTPVTSTGSSTSLATASFPIAPTRPIASVFTTSTTLAVDQTFPFTNVLTTTMGSSLTSVNSLTNIVTTELDSSVAQTSQIINVPTSTKGISVALTCPQTTVSQTTMGSSVVSTNSLKCLMTTSSTDNQTANNPSVASTPFISLDVVPTAMAGLLPDTPSLLRMTTTSGQLPDVPSLLRMTSRSPEVPSLLEGETSVADTRASPLDLRLDALPPPSTTPLDLSIAHDMTPNKTTAIQPVTRIDDRPISRLAQSCPAGSLIDLALSETNHRNEHDCIIGRSTDACYSNTSSNCKKSHENTVSENAVQITAPRAAQYSPSPDEDDILASYVSKDVSHDPSSVTPEPQSLISAPAASTSQAIGTFQACTALPQVPSPVEKPPCHQPHEMLQAGIGEKVSDTTKLPVDYSPQSKCSSPQQHVDPVTPPISTPPETTPLDDVVDLPSTSHEEISRTTEPDTAVAACSFNVVDFYSEPSSPESDASFASTIAYGQSSTPSSPGEDADNSPLATQTADTNPHHIVGRPISVLPVPDVVSDDEREHDRAMGVGHMTPDSGHVTSDSVSESGQIDRSSIDTLEPCTSQATAIPGKHKCNCKCPKPKDIYIELSDDE